VAEKALELGFCLGFTGPITFKNADSLRSVAAAVPLDRLLTETDGPFLTPHPLRGKRNEPTNVTIIAERLAALHNIPEDEMCEATRRNAERLFDLPAETRAGAG
jgi:TatD DNase family protein